MTTLGLSTYDGPGIATRGKMLLSCKKLKGNINSRNYFSNKNNRIRKQFFLIGKPTWLFLKTVLEL